MNMALHFLVVSDQRIFRHLLVALLKEIGFVKISEAANGEMALRAIKTTRIVGAPVELIITDCAMPLMDGLDLIRSIRQNPDSTHLPILMCTSRANRENILAAAKAGVDDYIVRPFSAASLLRKLEKMFAKLHLVTVDFPGV
jgi:two-component system chemotaxis response regulator CheY